MNDPTVTTTSAPRGVVISSSDESVAGDSGVFEASSAGVGVGGVGVGSSSGWRFRGVDDSSVLPHSAVDVDEVPDVAQVRISLRYSTTESLLIVGIEWARNFAALNPPSDASLYVLFFIIILVK